MMMVNPQRVTADVIEANEFPEMSEQFGVSVALFHRLNAERRRSWPGSFLATSTHDTKRSEDVRARLAVVSEIPQRWCESVRRWSARAADVGARAHGERTRLHRGAHRAEVGRVGQGWRGGLDGLEPDE